MVIQKREKPNARINPAGSIVSSIQSSRMRIKLHRLGLNELFGGAPSGMSRKFFNILLQATQGKNRFVAKYSLTTPPKHTQ
jgi:hypothetical protein